MIKLKYSRTKEEPDYCLIKQYIQDISGKTFSTVEEDVAFLSSMKVHVQIIDDGRNGVVLEFEDPTLETLFRLK